MAERSCPDNKNKLSHLADLNDQLKQAFSCFSIVSYFQDSSYTIFLVRPPFILSWYYVKICKTRNYLFSNIVSLTNTHIKIYFVACKEKMNLYIMAIW